MEAVTEGRTEDVVVLMKATCASTSGKKLTYEIGRTGESDDLQLRISGNTGTGAFTREWVPLHAIRDALKSAPPGEITSSTLRVLYAGRSTNTPGFLLAALASEGLLRPSRTKRRCYEAASDAEFGTAIDAWKNGSKRSPSSTGTRGSKRVKRDEAAQDGAAQAPENVPADAASSGAAAAIESIPAFTDVAGPQSATLKGPRKGKPKERQ